MRREAEIVSFLELLVTEQNLSKGDVKKKTTFDEMINCRIQMEKNVRVGRGGCGSVVGKTGKLCSWRL